jgi:hypothetical protein
MRVEVKAICAQYRAAQAAIEKLGEMNRHDVAVMLW